MKELEQLVTSLGVAIATIATWVTGWLPPAAALISIAWISFQWYHSEPMKERRRRRALAKEEP